MLETTPPTMFAHPDEMLPYLGRRGLAFACAGLVFGMWLVQRLGGAHELLAVLVALVLVALCAIACLALSFVRIAGREPERWARPCWRHLTAPRFTVPRPVRGWNAE